MRGILKETELEKVDLDGKILYIAVAVIKPRRVFKV
jgi:hypothetical protein